MEAIAVTPNKDLQVVILCGGQGTRIRDVADDIPKPMIPIGGKPIVWHIMQSYARYGFRRFILCLGYKGWEIKQYFLRYKEMHSDFTVAMDGSRPLQFHNQAGGEDWRVTCAETGLDSGTGARLRLVRDYVDTPTFCFTYGDAVGDVDIDALLEFHWAQGRVATVTGVHPTSRYGEMVVRDGRALEFNEKPTQAEGVVSGGFFVFQREVFDYLNDDPQLFLELDPLQRIARDGQLAVYQHQGFWHPMDTYRDYLHLNSLWRKGDPPWKIW
jgi:glucose-1-phosphate cytidylyltransferase